MNDASLERAWYLSTIGVTIGICEANQIARLPTLNETRVLFITQSKRSVPAGMQTRLSSSKKEFKLKGKARCREFEYSFLSLPFVHVHVTFATLKHGWGYSNFEFDVRLSLQERTKKVCNVGSD